MRSPHFKVQEMLAQAGKHGKAAPLAPAELFVRGYLPAQVSSGGEGSTRSRTGANHPDIS